MAKVRGTHSSPGVYTDIIDISYAAQTAGITKLGLVGETKMGPAFEPMPVTDWADFKSKFGGTSTETFYGSRYPKYELPYIAKSYLDASDQLQVCRVLGLSGYNAGTAFVITAGPTTNKYNGAYVVAVLRSKGSYLSGGVEDIYCNDGTSDYDKVVFDVDSIGLSPYTSPAKMDRCSTTATSGKTESNIVVSLANLGTFKISCYKSQNPNPIWTGVVSFNRDSKDYIYNVLGNTPARSDTNTAPIYVEEVYDYALERMVDEGKVNYIHANVLSTVTPSPNAVSTTCTDFINVPSYDLSKKLVGNVYVASGKELQNFTVFSAATETFWYYNVDSGSTVQETPLPLAEGGVYRVISYVKDGIKKCCYTPYKDAENNNVSLAKYTLASYASSNAPIDMVRLQPNGKMYVMGSDDKVTDYAAIGNYMEGYRWATTPWLVSEAKGDGSRLIVNRLFRLHTITDGNAANTLVKITIANIRPDEALFDLQVRDFNDSDAYPVVLESYKDLSMKPGTPNYIGLRIGTLDGRYEAVSKYVLAEIIENNTTRNSVPCGFLGYPIRDYAAAQMFSQNYASGVTAPVVEYNTQYNPDISDRKQYFGLSDVNGAYAVDVDLFKYKGVAAYTEDYTVGYTDSFHLDSSLNSLFRQSGLNLAPMVDGVMATSAITWQTVSPLYTTPYTHSPVISSEEDMQGCLFENKKLRKFTLYPCGGFDGWDENRTSRTNTDDYKYNKYKGVVKNGQGYAFSKVLNPESLGLDGNAITTDYYAYLAGVKQFEAPEKHQINLFATPGIDYVNNGLVVSEIVDMMENKRGDSLYVVTTPDKPFGAGETAEEMYTSEDAVDNLEDSGIDTYYACTYYPWVKYFDSDNNMYIHLPATKDVLRNMANVDNKRFPWIAPAGIERGNVDCKKMRFFARIEDEDTLYDGHINPLKTFSEDGVKVWGNKTMYTGDTPMNRINTVRLVLYMRFLITQAANKLIFEQNDVTLKDDLENLIRPILQDIKNDRGIFAYNIKTSQTQAQIDAHEMSGEIWVKPVPALEYIRLSFVITPTSVEFEDA